MRTILQDLQPMYLILAITMLVVVGAMAIDLVFGWRKAQERGDAHSSYAFSRTITKFVLYEGALFIAGGIDTLIHFGWQAFASTDYTIPCAAIFAGIVLCAVEIWSMKEKADAKTRNRINDVAELVAKTISKDQLVGLISEAIHKSREDEEKR